MGELGSAWAVRIGTGWSAIAPLAGSIAGAVILVGVALGLHWATRPDRRRRQRVLIAAVWVLAACFGTIAVLGLTAVAARPAAIVVTADAIWCAPWRDAVRWVDVESVSAHHRKARYGWRALGFELTVRATGVQPVAPPSLAPASWLGRLGLALARIEGGLPPIPGWTIGQRARPGATIACFGLGLEVPEDRVYRAVQELVRAAGPGSGQVADRRILHWCVAALPPFSWQCVSAAESLHQPCRDERGEAYGACVRRRYTESTWIGGPPPPPPR